MAKKAAPISGTQPARTRVVLVDDHASVREMLGMVLKVEGCYEVVGEAAGGLEAMKVCRATRPDLVILDLTLPELNGTHVIRLLLAESWPVRVVVYSGVSDEGVLRAALADGPHGFVRKGDSLAELRAALKAVASGSRHVSMRSEHLLAKRNAVGPRALTAQESAVVQMVAEGHQNKEMAAALGVSDKTVEHHRQHAMQKLGLHDVASLTRYAIRQRMVDA